MKRCFYLVLADDGAAEAILTLNVAHAVVPLGSEPTVDDLQSARDDIAADERAFGPEPSQGGNY